MKYIIDIDDDLPFDPQFLQLIGTEYTGTVRIRHIEFDMLEELTSDYVSENFGESQDAAYQRGLNDAWEAAMRVVADVDYGGLTLSALLRYSAQKAIPTSCKEIAPEKQLAN